MSTNTGIKIANRAGQCYPVLKKGGRHGDSTLLPGGGCAGLSGAAEPPPQGSCLIGNRQGMVTISSLQVTPT